MVVYLKAPILFSSILRTYTFTTLRRMATINDKMEGMRQSYEVESSISEDLTVKDPMELFKVWFQKAAEHPDILEPNAMTIATCSKDGYPTSRYVLLKGLTEKGFRFFTNYESQKGKQLLENPKASLTFYWEPMHMQVRICGDVEKLPEEDSTSYFHKRPRESQIGAVVSRQSQPIPNRKYLEDLREDIIKKYEGKEIPKPTYWGGFVITPVTMEFWCGGVGRLHDRIHFRIPAPNEAINSDLTKEGANGWVYERLSP